MSPINLNFNSKVPTLEEVLDPNGEIYNTLTEDEREYCEYLLSCRKSKEENIRKFFEDRYKKQKELDNKYKLCFIDTNTMRAYFTSQDLEKQWGDDWDDAPWEHNADHPYEYNPDRGDEEPYDILSIHFDVGSPYGDFLLQDSIGRGQEYRNADNTPFSVQDINVQKVVPWIDSPSTDLHRDEKLIIYAGCTLKEFIEKIMYFGGHIYFSVKMHDYIYSLVNVKEENHE